MPVGWPLSTGSHGAGGGGGAREGGNSPIPIGRAALPP
eukprot:SAG22_NODE_13733_length_396_cov_1.356902_1_plen_37_part_01